MRLACILTGGPEFDIQVEGERYHFEMHPYCGPNVLTEKGEPAANQPIPFLKAASLWDQQGQRLEDGLCIWDHEPKPILQHIGGKHYRVLGYHPPERGC